MKTNTQSALFQAIQNSASIKRCEGEKLLPFLTRSYESAAGLTPTIPSPDAAAIRSAVAARLEVSRAKSFASRAVASARQAVRAIVPVSPTGAIARKIAEAAQPIALKDASDAYLIQAATHRFSDEAERPAAIAELERRGIRISNGVICKNLKTRQA
jgi:hypothetical protein